MEQPRQERQRSQRSPIEVRDREKRRAAVALHKAIVDHDEAAIPQLLTAEALDINMEVSSMAPLLTACCDGGGYYCNKNIVRMLLEYGAPVDGIDEAEDTPLTVACYALDSNCSEACVEATGIIRLLLDAGANPNGNGSNVCPLVLAAHAGATEAIELLIDAGADVNRVHTEFNFHHYPVGSTALHVAAEGHDAIIPNDDELYPENLQTIRMLVAAGADVNLRDNRGANPLSNAVLSLRPIEMIMTLLDAGCDPLCLRILILDDEDDDDADPPPGRTCLQCLNEYTEQVYSTQYRKEWGCEVISALVAAGDRSWACVPTPCPGLEKAMVSVWKAAPHEMPELVKRLQNPPRTLEELFPRMPDELKKIVQETLRAVKRVTESPSVKDHLFNLLFGFF